MPPRGPMGLNHGLGILGRGPMPPRGRMRPPMFPPGIRPPVGAVPPGYGDPDFGEDQVKEYLRNHQNENEYREEEQEEAVEYDKDWDQSREKTPTPEDNLDFADDGGNPQKRGYETLQEKQKERKASLDAVKETNPMFKEENWYSSDEEDGPPDSKKAKAETEEQPEKPELPPKEEAKSKRDPRMMRRDPRQNREQQSNADAERDNRLLNVDLSMFGELDIPNFAKEEEEEEDNNYGLPFKPHKMPAAAKEIDASIYSHSPLDYILRAVVVTKPDYSDMILRQHIPASKVQVDPRLRRYANAKKADSVSPKKEEEDNVYNPKRDLYPKDVYSPSQNVNDMYNKPDANVYNPRQDLGNARPEGWGSQDAYAGNSFDNAGPGFYGQQQRQQQQQPDNGFYGSGGGNGGGGFGYNNDGFSNRGGGFGGHRGGSRDPRANRRDPRQRT